MSDFEHARQHMVKAHLAGRGIRDQGVLDAMLHVPRERFVESGMEERAYEDTPLPIGEGQTISQPFIVAHMIELAAIKPSDRVLEVGTGSGYAAAVMSRLAERVFTMERHRTLGEQAERRLRTQGYDNVRVLIGDGSKGWADEAPFDAIILAAGGPVVPATLKEQLRIGGRLVLPVDKAEERHQRLIRITRASATSYEEEDFGAVKFVPLIVE